MLQEEDKGVIAFPDDEPNAMTFVLAWLYGFPSRDCFRKASRARICPTLIHRLAEKYNLPDIKTWIRTYVIKNGNVVLADIGQQPDDDTLAWNTILEWLHVCSELNLVPEVCKLLQINASSMLMRKQDRLEQICSAYPKIGARLIVAGGLGRSDEEED
jgi:hypothetical protein